MKKYILFFTVLLTASPFVPETSYASIVIPANESPILSGNPDPSTVKSSIQEFKSLSKKERKERIKEVKTLIRHYKAEKKSGKEGSDNTVLLAILAILLPPLAVYLYEGEINSRFWIDLLLTLIFWLPGVIYALIVIFGGD